MTRVIFFFLLSLYSGFISGLTGAERVALVIGNNAYVHAKALTNPLNDIAAVSERLEGGGWKVSRARDAGVLAMRRAVREFCENAAGAEAAMVFFAGHGIEVRGKNYLLPVDARLSEEAGEDALALETLALNDLLASLGSSGAKLKIVVLDSCRDNPLSRSWLDSRSGGGGLAAVGEKTLAEGTMLVFSTAPGKVAADGAGKNSPFTTAWLERMAGGGGVADIFGDVAVAMGARQEAWISFDGSGRSFAAFRAFPLFPVAGRAASAPVSPSPPPLARDDYASFAGNQAGDSRLVEVAPGMSLPFRWCPPGKFQAGSSDRERETTVGWNWDPSDEEARHQAIIESGFWMAETEVTQAQWKSVMKTGIRQQAGKLITGELFQFADKRTTWLEWKKLEKDTTAEDLLGVEGDSIPMYYVNRAECARWCDAAQAHVARSGWRITLPTETQWEYACRSGSETMTPMGDFTIAEDGKASLLDRIGWYYRNSHEGYRGKGWTRRLKGGDSLTLGPRRVATKAANAWGLHDMLGNMNEWCEGAYDHVGEFNKLGIKTQVSRGGSWYDPAVALRAASRRGHEPGVRDWDLGFRPVLVSVR